MKKKLNNLIQVKNLPVGRSQKRQSEREYKKTLELILPLFQAYYELESVPSDLDRSNFNDMFIKKANVINKNNVFVAVNTRAFLMNADETIEEIQEIQDSVDKPRLIAFCLILFIAIIILMCFF